MLPAGRAGHAGLQFRALEGMPATVRAERSRPQLMALLGSLHPLTEVTVVLLTDEPRIVACWWFRGHAAFNSIGSELA